MGEEQPEQLPDQKEGAIDYERLKALAADLREQGVDIEDEDFEGKPADEAMELMMIAAIQVDIDIEPMLVQHGLIENIENNSEDVSHLQNQGYESYSSQDADRLYQDEAEE